MINRVYGLMGISAKAGKVISGAEIVLKEMLKNKIYFVIVAEDASENTKKNIRLHCDRQQIHMAIWGDIRNNSKAIGKQNRAVIGIKDKNLSEAIQKVICGGETFGEN